MHTRSARNKKSNNEQLRDLLRRANLKQAEALEMFNKALGPAAYSMSAWRSFFVKPTSTRFRPFKDALLAHAKSVFETSRRKRS